MILRARTVIVSLLAMTVLCVGAATSAQAAAYRYWTYWQGGSGTWTFSTAGPAYLVPADGSVEGWRFAVTTTAGQLADAPASEPSFATICGDTPAEVDRKRVALIVDPGPLSIAPDGQTPPSPITQCVVAEQDATGYEVLRSVTTVQTDQGLVCGIADYPTDECAPVVEDSAAVQDNTGIPSSAAMEPTTGSSTSSGGAPLITVGVIAVALVAGLVMWRRTRHD